ncbi:MAG TPA: hypothetical protein VFL51_04845 [Pseudolabrys sp.]|nr:hypothetical protein [Pseudolabrys sp.]
MTNITVATPAFGEMFYTPYVRSLLQLQSAVMKRGGALHQSVISYVYVTDSRNFLLTHWYDKSDDPYLLFVDADMGFEPQLVFDMIAFDKPVTGVIYTKRQIDLKRLAAAAGKGLAPERAIAQAHDFIIRPLRGRPARREKGFMEVEGIGTGILLIRRDAIATMLEKLPAINDTNAKKTSPLASNLDRMIRAFDTLDAGGVPLTDDFAFCYRWHALCKGEVWARADQAVTHLGLQRFSSRYTDAGGSSPRITVTKGKPVVLGSGAKAPEAQADVGRRAADAVRED